MRQLDQTVTRGFQITMGVNLISNLLKLGFNNRIMAVVTQA